MQTGRELLGAGVAGAWALPVPAWARGGAPTLPAARASAFPVPAYGCRSIRQIELPREISAEYAMYRPSGESE